MNQDYELFCGELKGLTNAEAITEIIKKIQILKWKRLENNRATIFEERLKQLLSNTGELERNEMFKLNEIYKRY